MYCVCTQGGGSCFFTKKHRKMKRKAGKIMKGIVMDIQKFCLQDGPGIRTTVFLKGCNMKCQWCHNPESMELNPVLMYVKDKCIGCGKCGSVCPEGVHSFLEGEHGVIRQKCTGCGKCAAVCPAQALAVNGREMEASQVLEEIRKDEKYYASSGGGVTFSGGEATLQFDFLLELLKGCREMGYATALETNGLVSEKRMRVLFEYTDLFLLDYKVTGPEHEKWTGVPGGSVLHTLSLLEELGGHVILRCPLIPGVNDTEEHFIAINTLQKKFHCIEGTEIMAYHDTGKGKWEECGKQYSLSHIKTVSVEQKKQWESKI